jgi:hypothetical protein
VRRAPPVKTAVHMCVVRGLSAMSWQFRIGVELAVDRKQMTKARKQPQGHTMCPSSGVVLRFGGEQRFRRFDR